MEIARSRLGRSRGLRKKKLVFCVWDICNGSSRGLCQELWAHNNSGAASGSMHVHSGRAVVAAAAVVLGTTSPCSLLGHKQPCCSAGGMRQVLNDVHCSHDLC